MNKKMMKGFTLVEIMIVVAIIAILAAIAIPNFIKYRSESQSAACEATRASIVTAAENWSSKTANADATSVSLDDLAPEDGTGYFKTVPTCPTKGTLTVSRKSKNDPWVCNCTDHAASEAEGGDGE